jgi:hypothetical protein
MPHLPDFMWTAAHFAAASGHFGIAYAYALTRCLYQGVNCKRSEAIQN